MSIECNIQGKAENKCNSPCGHSKKKVYAMFDDYEHNSL